MEQDREDYDLFLEGDNAGFDRLVLRYKDGLIQFLFRLTRDLYQAEDLAQDAFVEILLHPERYRRDVSFKTYLYTIGHHKAVDFIRKGKPLMFVGEYEEAEQKEETLLEEKVIKEEEKRELYQAMKKLKPEYGHALLLVDIEGLSYAEAARVLKKSESQLKVLIHRARKRLKEVLCQAGRK